MKITNNYGIPKIFEKALFDNPHQKTGDYSITQLLNDPTPVVLGKRYKDLITTDINEYISRIIGMGVHRLLEISAYDNPHLIVEHMVEFEIEGIKISGILDLYDKEKNEIQDYKTWKLYKVLRNNFSDVEAQLNMYAYGMRQEGYKVDSIKAIAILKDYSKQKAVLKEPDDYPLIENKYEEEGVWYLPQVVVINLPLWTDEQIISFATEKVRALIEAEGIDDDNLPVCKERYMTPIKYKVFKKGSKRATKVFDVEEDAKKFVEEKGDGYEIVKEGGIPRRCLEFCDVNMFCPHYLKYINNKEV